MNGLLSIILAWFIGLLVFNGLLNSSQNWVVLLMVQKSQTTTWDVQNLVNNGINYLSTGAGFQPSTVIQSPIYPKQPGFP